ncbi:MAG: hypothetical protein ACOZCO_12940 [Bacteroidota bacterium]
MPKVKFSSQEGDKTSATNKKTAAQCVKNPFLLKEVAKALSSKDKYLVADAAEIFTEAGMENPKLVVPYVNKLIPLLTSTHTRSRWEAMHAIALCAHLRPEAVESILPEIQHIIHHDESVIVRDHTANALILFAGTSKKNAEKAVPCLLDMLDKWKDKHAHQVLRGLNESYPCLPGIKNKIINIAAEYSESKRAVVKKEAQKLLKLLTAG